MARHRNVRNMNFDEDYEGYNDVYGHSVEDNYCPSPTTSQYMYNRSDTQMSAFFSPEEADIEEEPEDEDKRKMEKLSDHVESLTLESAIIDLLPEEEILLKSCLEEIQNVMGDSTPDSIIIAQILRANFNLEKALDACLRGATEPQLQPEGEEKMMMNRRGEIKVGKVLEDKKTVTAETQKDIDRKLIEMGGKIGNKSEPVKIIPTGSITVGFELPSSSQREILKEIKSDKDLTIYNDCKNNSKTPSPVPDEKKEESTRVVKSKEFKSDLAVKEYIKQRSGGKELLSLLVIGHVDAGKSTLMGHLLWQLGQVAKKTMHKFEQESKKLGKQSFLYAWVLDETGEERARGITMDVGQSKFETGTKSVILLDAPGHKDFIPNMITGATQADVAVLVVDSTKGEFETGFESGGQTREHTLLSRSLGVGQLIIAVNKLDTVNWSQTRFDEIKVKLSSFLVKQAGYRENDITFIPCSGLIGQNLTKKCTEIQLNNWYNGQTLLQAIDSLRSPDRPVGKPLRLTVNDVFKGSGGLCIGGRVETGMIQPGDKILIQPIGEMAIVKGITNDDENGSIAFAGDQILVTLQNLPDASVGIGCVLSDINHPSRVCSKFQARIVTFDAMSIPLVKGSTCVIFLACQVEQIVIKKLINITHKGTGEVTKLKPRCFVKNSNGLVEMETSKAICIEEFKDVKELGRFTLRSAGITIAAGVVTQVF